MKYTMILLCWLCVSSCSLATKYTNNDIHKKYSVVSFCDLAANIGKDVIVEGAFRGSNEEYMFFGPVNYNCADLPPICLGFKDYNKLPADVKKKYLSVRSNYQTTYLAIKGIGQFITDAKCGHLGANEFAFIMKEVIDIKIVKK